VPFESSYCIIAALKAVSSGRWVRTIDCNGNGKMDLPLSNGVVVE
jgi:hypothetical protein